MIECSNFPATSLSISDSKKRGNSYVVCVKKSNVSEIGGNTKKDEGASKKTGQTNRGRCRDVFV